MFALLSVHAPHLSSSFIKSLEQDPLSCLFKWEIVVIVCTWFSLAPKLTCLVLWFHGSSEMYSISRHCMDGWTKRNLKSEKLESKFLPNFDVLIFSLLLNYIHIANLLVVPIQMLETSHVRQFQESVCKLLDPYLDVVIMVKSYLKLVTQQLVRKLKYLLERPLLYNFAQIILCEYCLVRWLGV